MRQLQLERIGLEKGKFAGHRPTFYHYAMPLHGCMCACVCMYIIMSFYFLFLSGCT